MLGLKSFCSAAITLAGIELAHRIRKGQYALERRHDEGSSSLKELWDVALNQEEMPHVCRDFYPPMRPNPDISFSRAQARHQVARQLLAVGLDPSCNREELRRDG